MDDGVRKRVREWLEQDVVGLFLGYRMLCGHPLPHAFSKQKIEEVQGLVTGPVRYPLVRVARQIRVLHPEVTLGLLAWDCDQRALSVLSAWNQIELGKVKAIHLSCRPSPLTEKVRCPCLEPRVSGSCKGRLGLEFMAKTGDVEAVEPAERFRRWMYEFQKCIKCYGCRDICPVCFCKECSLEHPDLLGTGRLPPEVPLFHLVRAVHMAGRCVDCGLCEEACPAEIPLRLLYRKANAIVKEVFGYEAGAGPDPSPFHVMGNVLNLEPKAI
jgi:formate dehydrogenase (coenzyme F420) beta subunit